ncbi:MAG: biotin/lipoyl-binding protein, partial [Bacteroidales bacterium]|nr:biotin/lipoyl-binding protein [Bacteroidales bacterium]
MKEDKAEILHSEAVREIISNPPGKLVRWGTAAISAVILIILIFAWIIRYPNVVPSPVMITTENPPVTLVSKISGRILNWYVSDGETVRTGHLLAVMETAASIDQVRKLRESIEEIQDPGSISAGSLPSFSELGEIQEYWGSFLKNLSDYDNYVKNDFYGYKISSVIREIGGLEEYILRVKEKEKFYLENQRIEERKFIRDSSLFADKVFSESELDISRQTFNKINIELQDVRLDHAARILELARKNQELQDYRIKMVEERARLFSILTESLNNLKAQIRIWEKTYLIISPVDGIV